MILNFILFMLIFQYSSTVSLHGLHNYRIIGGRPATEGEFPYQAALLHNANQKLFCGGAIISEWHILTAAHCAFTLWGANMQAGFIQIMVGQVQLNVNNKTVLRKAKKVTVHPGYNSDTMENDLAVIELTNKLPLNGELIAPIQLNKNKFVSNLSCIVTGWGVQKFDTTELSNSLRAAPLSTISQELCQDKYDKIEVILYKGMLCATYEDHAQAVDACQGDSGGPLVCKGFLTGIVSTGHGCGNNKFPGIYTNVQFFGDWIKKTMIYENDDIDLTHVTTERSANKTHNQVLMEISNSEKEPILVFSRNDTLTSLSLFEVNSIRNNFLRAIIQFISLVAVVINLVF